MGFCAGGSAADDGPARARRRERGMERRIVEGFEGVEARLDLGIGWMLGCLGVSLFGCLDERGFVGH